MPRKSPKTKTVKLVCPKCNTPREVRALNGIRGVTQQHSVCRKCARDFMARKMGAKDHG